MTTSIPLFESLQNHQNSKMGMGHLRCFNDKGTAQQEFTMPVVRGDSPRAIVDLPASQPQSFTDSDHGFFGSVFDKDMSSSGSDASSISSADYHVILGLARDLKKLQSRLRPSDTELGYVDKLTEDSPAVFGGEVGDVDALREAIRNYDPDDDNTLLEEQIKQAFNYASTDDAKRLLAIAPQLFEDPSKVAVVSRHMRDYVPEIPDGVLGDYAREQATKVHLDPDIVDKLASDDFQYRPSTSYSPTMEDYARALPASGDVNDMGDPSSYRDFDDFDFSDDDTSDVDDYNFVSDSDDSYDYDDSNDDYDDDSDDGYYDDSDDYYDDPEDYYDLDDYENIFYGEED